MPHIPHRELSRTVNAEARRRYPTVAKQLGASGLATAVSTRLSLRFNTPYPYSFTKDDSLFPSADNVFGRVIERSRQEGLEEIHSSIDKQDREHKWLFVPAAQIWVDTTLTADETSVDSDQYAHIFLSYLFPEIESVHTHPDTTARNLARDEPWSFSHNFLLEAALPSTNDLIGHGQMVARTSPDSHQVGSVVSHYGVTSFFLLGDSGGFQTEAYNRLAQDSSDPVATIREVLGRLSAHVLHFDGTPAISVGFEPIR